MSTTLAPASATPAVAPGRSLAHLPVTLFSSVMGLGGVSLAWRRAARVWDLPEWPALAFLGLAALAFVVVGGAYLLKWVRFPAAARAELRHPVRMTFAPTVTISLLVLATAGQDLAPGLASVLWWVGAVGHLLATLAVVGAWFGRADIVHGSVTPAWFIPVVGNVITPLAAREIGSVELAWFAFGVGIVFWLGLLPLLLQRVLLHDAVLPEKLLPTIAIFVAPPSVAMLSWGALTGSVDDPVGRVLFAAAMSFVAILVGQVGRLRRIPFALPYWAYTFPLAAASAAAVAMAGARPQMAYDVMAWLLLVATTLAGPRRQRADAAARGTRPDLPAGVRSRDDRRIVATVAPGARRRGAPGRRVLRARCAARRLRTRRGGGARAVPDPRRGLDARGGRGRPGGGSRRRARSSGGGARGPRHLTARATPTGGSMRTGSGCATTWRPRCGPWYPTGCSSSTRSRGSPGTRTTRRRRRPPWRWAPPSASRCSAGRYPRWWPRPCVPRRGRGSPGTRWRTLTEVTVDRTRQLEAVHCHATQAVPGSVLWRRLELLGDREFVRELVPADARRGGGDAEGSPRHVGAP